MIKCAWNPLAARVLEGALGEDAGEIAQEIDEGRAELWHYPPATFLVTRIEISPKGRELVLVASAGEAGQAIAGSGLPLPKVPTARACGCIRAGRGWGAICCRWDSSRWKRFIKRR